jgi:cell division protein FtsQ
MPPPGAPRRFAAGALVVLALLAPGWLLVRDSSIVGVSDVVITGVSGPQTAQIEDALETAAREMTTLHVDVQRLRDAVERYPIVASVTADGKLLHRLEIHVEQHQAVGALAHGDQRLAVAEDGTILQGWLTKDLPLVPVASPPGGRSVADRDALEMVTLLGAAPAPLRARIGRVEMADTGLIAFVNDGPELRFGPADHLPAKWIAATQVLSDAMSRGAAYVDVRVPERPAAGGLEETTTPQPEVETVTP